MKLDFPHILIVDDDEGFARALSRWLRQLGYTPLHAATAAEGAELLDASISVVLLDLQLPDIHGHAFLRQLKRSGNSIPVIVISGTAETEDVIRVWRENAADFLKKPFQLDELATALDRSLTRRAASHSPEVPPSSPSSEEPSAHHERPEPTTLSGMPGNSRARRHAEIRPAVARLREKIRSGDVEIPILDPKVADLQSFLTRDDYGAQEVVDAVSRDGALAASVLRTANSSAYSRGAPVKTLLDACSRLGPKRVIGVALEVTVRNQFSVPNKRMRRLLDDMWKNSVVTSHAAALLAKHLKRSDADDVRIAALMHNVGEVVSVCMFCELSSGPDVALESLALDVERIHEDIGLALARAWKMPTSLARLLGYHHRGRVNEPAGFTQTRRLVVGAWKLALRAGFTYFPNQDTVDTRPELEPLGVDLDAEQRLLEAVTRLSP